MSVESRITNHESREVLQTSLPLPLYGRGKVRDVYEAGEDLLIVATDRISAFDHVLPTPVPDKGRVLTALSAFWFSRTGSIVANHMIAWDPVEIVRRVPGLDAATLPVLAGRAMLVQRCERIDVECVVRGYLTGSAWEEYRRTGAVAGVALPPGLRNGDALPEPIFTPATKAATGHDANITYTDLIETVGGSVAGDLRELSVRLYTFAATHAALCGLILADTKFEFGRRAGRVLLIDEALTPDSSRYWDAGSYPQSLLPFDKQYVRDYLNAIGWNHEPPVPTLPVEVVAATRERYLETYRRLTGQELRDS